MIRYNLCPLPGYPWEYDKVLSWARYAVSLQDKFKIFLTGTILPAASLHRHPHNQYATRSTHSSPLVMFKGTSGILEMIAAYIEKPSARAVRTLRQLLALLPAVIEDTPFSTFPRRSLEETDEEQQDDDDDYWALCTNCANQADTNERTKIWCSGLIRWSINYRWHVLWIARFI